MMKEKLRGRIQGGVGFITLLVAEVMLFQGVEPFASWFYCFVWWAYILIVDSVIYELKGDSLIINRTREFLWLIPWSVVIWLIFELMNVLMKNWYYVNVIDSLWARWLGYFLAYSTVLPGIFETTELLDTIGLFKKKRSAKRVHLEKKWLKVSCMVGVLLFVSLLLFPRFCFPFSWLGFIFLLEPVNYWLGGRSLLRAWERGNWQRLYHLLLAGMVCGLSWEFWNYWARTKWIYTVPFFEELKLFEMPMLGFLGFLPFAVECYVIYNFICLLGRREGWERGSESLVKGSPLRYPAQIALAVGFFIFSILSFRAIDTYTVNSYSSFLKDLDFITPQLIKRLEEMGIRTTDDFLRTVNDQETTEDLSQELQVSKDEVKEWTKHVRLIALKGLGIENFYLLKKLEIDRVSKLVPLKPEKLHQDLMLLVQTDGKRKEVPTLSMVKIWIQEARKQNAETL